MDDHRQGKNNEKQSDGRVTHSHGDYLPCFIGDDLPDIPVMKQVGLAIAVNNATELTKRHAHYVTRKGGGDGAVREAIELILKFQGKLENTIKKIWND